MQTSPRQTFQPSTPRRRGLATAVLVTVSTLVLALVAATPVVAVQDPSAGLPTCRVRADLVRLSEPLPRVAQKLTRGEALKIVALGSSSTAGLGASDPAHTYPSRLQAELQSHYPNSPITVVNKGVNGNETRDEILRFDRDVMAEKPDLLIWQVGTNTLLNHHDMWPVFLHLRDGVARVRAIGADVVVMNPQYSPRVLERPDYSAMNDLVTVAGRELRVGVFDRFSLMKSWVEAERMPFSAFVTGDGLHMNDWAYDCIARGLVQSISGATARNFARH